MFTVAISVYKKDNPSHFETALNSIQSQTFPPTEIVLVIDGPITEKHEAVIRAQKNTYNNLVTIYLDKNQGHGIARQTGILNSSNNIVALMDSDDISMPDRFEKQYKIMCEEPHLSALGGQIQEFDEITGKLCGFRKVPYDHWQIVKYMKNRCPFNQMTVMLRRSDVLAAGGYMDWYMNEDYYLWLRMLTNGCRFRNMPDLLVKARVGNNMYARRGGWRYFKSEVLLKKYMYDKKLISMHALLYNVIIRFFVQVVVPNRIRAVLFKYIFRSKTK